MLLEFISDTRHASVQSQIVVRASSNEPHAQEALREAIRVATQACQALAFLTDLHTFIPDVPPALIDARHRFRELVTEEGNLDIVNPADRQDRCEAIEIATATLQREMRDFAYKRWGIGLGSKAGRL